MEKLLLLAVLSASVSCSPRVRRTNDNPNNEYNGYEQAPYSVIQKYKVCGQEENLLRIVRKDDFLGQDFESRSYPPASWACTEGVLTSSSDSDEMFHKLFRCGMGGIRSVSSLTLFTGTSLERMQGSRR